MTQDPLDSFGWAPERAGLFLDFDGVLADIAPEPDGAIIRAGVDGLLVALCRVLGRVVVISGRPVDYLDAMVPTEVDIVGLYGLEGRRAGERHTMQEAEPYRATVRELTEEATARFGAAVVEPKGLSLTVHYRSDDALAEPMKSWATDAAARTGMEQRAAKRSVELHPPVAYVGDDPGDLPAFDGLDRLAAGGVTTVRVAVDSAEAPAALRRRADLVVDGPGGAEVLLRRILVLAGASPD